MVHLRKDGEKIQKHLNFFTEKNLCSGFKHMYKKMSESFMISFIAGRITTVLSQKKS